jgi:hypothetical protein
MQRRLAWYRAREACEELFDVRTLFLDPNPVTGIITYQHSNFFLDPWGI